MKRNKVKKIKTMTLIICILLTAMSFSTAVSSIASRSNRNEDKLRTPTLVYEFTFPEPQLCDKKVGSQTFTEIVLPGSFSIGKQAGTPTFPVIPIRLLLPQGTDVTGINVNPVGTLEINVEDKGFNLAEKPIIPYQDQVPIGMEQMDFVINHDAYLSRNDVLGDRLFTNSGVGYCRGYAILTVNLYPTKYIPGEHKLFYHPNMRIEVDLEETGDADCFYRSGNLDDRQWVESLVDNPETISTYSLVDFDDNHYEGGLCDPTDNNGQGYDYVIITRDALSDFTGTTYNWTNLILRKQAQGLEATIVTVENILACPDYYNTTDPLFNDTAARIREFCRDAYMDWYTQYILVAGDQDGPNAVERRLMDSDFELDMESDLYWSNLDNTFNNDLDDFWGERDDDGFDLYSELFIGSIPCDEPLDISNWLTKSFFYGDNYDPEYLDNAGFYGGSTGWPCEGDDFIDYGAIKGTDDWLGPDPGEHGAYPGWLGFLYGFETWNDYNLGFEFNLSVKWTGDDPNPGWQGGSPTIAIEEFKNKINNNQVTLITSFAHANPYLSLDVWNDEWESSEYHNTKPFFLCDWGCHCGDMDGADDGVLHSMLFHSDTSLAFGCVYNTGYGWGSFADTNSSSGLQQKLFWDYLFNLSKCGGVENWQLGKAMAWSKDSMANTIDWTYRSAPDSWRAIIECCLLFADPAQIIKPPMREGHNVGIYSMDVSPYHIRSPEPISINTTIMNNGMNDETDVVVRLLVNGEVVDSVFIPFLQCFTSQQVNFTWFPSDLGVYAITVNVTITDDVEEYFEDNEKTETVVIGVQNVDTSECFTAIQLAIDDTNTSSGHCIIVPSGIYCENTVINKNISLLGMNRDTTIIAGTGYAGSTIHVSNTNAVTITGLTIKNQTYGVIVDSSSNTLIMDTLIVDNIETGISLMSSDNTTIFENEIFSNDIGIHITGSSNLNAIVENEIFENQIGLIIDPGSNNNRLYHNNFNNAHNAFNNGSNNQWDNGYSEGFRINGGNWWSDYDGVDEFSGPDQNEPGSDGIGDIPFNISGVSGSQDQYPLMEPFTGPLTGTIYVDDDNINGPWDGTIEHPFQYIQDAMNVSIDSDTIFAFSGLYQENIIVDRSIHLIGEDKETTIIDGNLVGHVIWVTADMVDITGFTVQNSGTSENDAGIYIKSNHNTIIGNTIANNSCGVHIYKRSNNIISENTITNRDGNSIGILIYSASHNNIVSDNMILHTDYGINLRYCSENHISENTIIDTMVGIASSGTSDNIITRNTVSDSNRGISISFSSCDNLVSENTFEDCSREGICLDRLWAQTNNIITNNSFDSGGIYINAWYYYSWNAHTIENNTINGRPIRYYKNMNNLVVPQDTGQVILANCSNFTIQNLAISDVYCGIQLGDSSHSTIERNMITNNTAYGSGIEITVHSNNNEIHRNTISLNSGKGIVLAFSSRNNVIYYNNLAGGDMGVSLFGFCDNNTFSDNEIKNNRFGVNLADSHNNTIHSNTISNNTLFGIFIGGRQFFEGGRDLPMNSENNTICHNNFNNNSQHAYDGCNNYWDNGYPLGGNYWDDFDEPGEGAWDNDSNGIVDTPYDILSGNNQDFYPLINPFVLGDMNLDGDVSWRDIQPFRLALENPDEYQNQYGILPEIHGDINQDGVMNWRDVDPFVDLLVL